MTIWRILRCPSAGRQHRRSREGGAAATEMALAVLLLVPLLSGIIDGGVLLQHRRITADAARSAARQGARSCWTAPGCVSGNYPNADLAILSGIASVLGSRVPRVTRVIIFRATESNAAVPADCLASSTGVADRCNIYLNPFAADGTIVATPAALWPAMSRVRSLAMADHVGVHVEYSHQSVIGLVVPPTMTVRARAVFRLEPPLVLSPARPQLPVFAQAPFPWEWTAPCESDCDDDGSGSTVNPGNGAG